MNDLEPTLPRRRAFLVQLGRDATRFGGRVEHLASGDVCRFTTWEELRGFLTAVLARERALRALQADQGGVGRGDS